jgi:putative membrane protein insertion efficiency factor
MLQVFICNMRCRIMNKIQVFAVIILTVQSSVYGEFVPWQRKVNVADENMGRYSHSRNRDDYVLNGFQGGAYLLVRFFQMAISTQDGPNCRHTPVCSAYARGAVKKHGAFAGSLLAGDRLLRCNPFYYLDKDPVPQEVLGE